MASHCIRLGRAPCTTAKSMARAGKKPAIGATIDIGPLASAA